MRLTHSTWQEIDAYLTISDGILIPTGSIEQHGPIGLIGTDMLCADDIAVAAGEAANFLVAPPLGYAPAEFNMGFAGTISISQDTYRNLCGEIFHALERHGFRHIYILNGHGANLEPLAEAADAVSKAKLRIKSWWDFEGVKLLRQAFYGDWEGMHATPSEIAITQVAHRSVDAALASEPPEKLTQDFVRTHAGDKHGSADEHRAQFPDGRVGSHSALATRAQGAQLKAAAVSALIKDYEKFVGS